MISTQFKEGAIGDAGNISVNTGNLNVENNGQSTSSKAGQGNAGNINLQVRDTTDLNNSVASTSDGTGGIAPAPFEVLEVDNIQTDWITLDDDMAQPSTTPGPIEGYFELEQFNQAINFQ